MKKNRIILILIFAVGIVSVTYFILNFYFITSNDKMFFTNEGTVIEVAKSLLKVEVVNELEGTKNIINFKISENTKISKTLEEIKSSQDFEKEQTKYLSDINEGIVQEAPSWNKKAKISLTEIANGDKIKISFYNKKNVISVLVIPLPKVENSFSLNDDFEILNGRIIAIDDSNISLCLVDPMLTEECIMNYKIKHDEMLIFKEKYFIGNENKADNIRERSITLSDINVGDNVQIKTKIENGNYSAVKIIKIITE